MIRRSLAGLLFTLSVGCAQDAPEATGRDLVPSTGLSEDDRTLQAELLVARDLLRRASTDQVVVDSMYATPGQAPGSPSLEMRPPSRTLRLRDSLNVNRGQSQVIVLRLSKAEAADNEVRITATIDYPQATQPGGRGYETVEYLLQDSGATWKIRTRVQLGIS